MDCLEDEDRGGDAVDCCGSDMSWTGYIVRKKKRIGSCGSCGGGGGGGEVEAVMLEILSIAVR